MDSRQRRLPFAIATAILLLSAPANAVIVYEKGGSDPIRGYLVSADKDTVVINEVLPGGGTRPRSFSRASIEEPIIAVDAGRLATLTPDHPAGYRDYAEELAVKRLDPEAQEAAIRLYLIAASLDPGELGRSCLLGMTALARSSQEERRFRAMAYLLDREHDRTLLKPPTAPPAAPETHTDGEHSMLRNFFRLLRMRNSTEARSMLSRPPVQEALARLGPSLDLEELKAATAPGAMVSPELLRKTLALELQLSDAPVRPVASTSLATESWSQTLARGGARPTIPLSFETITEFNPKECVFRNGKWAPADAASRSGGTAAK